MLRNHQAEGMGAVVLLALAVALAGSALVAVSASAAIEMLYCMEVTVNTGKYETQAKCEKADTTGTGSLNWELGAPLTGQSVEVDFKGSGAHLNTPGHEIECTANTGSGTVTGANAYSKITIKSTGCKDTVFGIACNSTEPAGGSGEIITKELDAELVYLKAGAKTPVGILLLPTGSTIFTRISCVGGIVKESVTGEVIGELEGVKLNIMTESLNVFFAENGSGAQLWTKVEEAGSAHELMAFGEKAYEVATDALECLVEHVKVACEIMA